MQLVSLATGHQEEPKLEHLGICYCIYCMYSRVIGGRALGLTCGYVWDPYPCQDKETLS